MVALAGGEVKDRTQRRPCEPRNRLPTLATQRGIQYGQSFGRADVCPTAAEVFAADGVADHRGAQQRRE